MRNICDFIRVLPSDVKRVIFYYIPLRYIRNDATKLISNMIDVYNIDNDHELSRVFNYFYIKHIMSFHDYIFYTLQIDDSECEYGRKVYDTLVLA